MIVLNYGGKLGTPIGVSAQKNVEAAKQFPTLDVEPASAACLKRVVK